MRDIKSAVDEGNDRARLAREKFIYDIRRYLGEYLVLMGGLDAVTFTGGIGQKDAELRSSVLDSLSFLGMTIDRDRNDKHELIISSGESSIKALVLETNEELVVARETMRLIREKR
jgi:acetate kinase